MPEEYKLESGVMPTEDQPIRVAYLPREVRFRVQKFLGKGPIFTLSQIPADKRGLVLELFARRQAELSSNRKNRPTGAGPTKAPMPELPG